MIANVLSAVWFGTSRSVFIWLVGELTEWNPATAILGILIGLPPLFLSAWAGSLADRLQPRSFGTTMFLISAKGLGSTGLLVTADCVAGAGLIGRVHTSGASDPGPRRAHRG